MSFRQADILAAMSEPKDPAAVPPHGPAADGRPAPSWLGSRLRWFLAEFLVVGVGVLVALGLSGLVEEQRELQREQVYLQQLSADLGSSDKELSTAAASARVSCTGSGGKTRCWTMRFSSILRSRVAPAASGLCWEPPKRWVRPARWG